MKSGGGYPVFPAEKGSSLMGSIKDLTMSCAPTQCDLGRNFRDFRIC